MSLYEQGYEPTGAECPECEEGSLWVNSFELVCGECGLVFRNGSTGTEDPAQDFRQDRERYDSGAVILPGGFEHAYYGPGIYGEGD